MSLGTRLFVLVAPAVLPPADAEDREFYELLDLPRQASFEDIKKAYRQKSLALHPDKVAQRRETENAAAAAAEYELVQEAYAALHETHHRQLYHAVQCSVARYRFFQSGASQNPAALYENLSRASCWNRTKLVVIVAVLAGFLLLLQPILVAAKVNAIVRHENNTTHADDDDDDPILDVSWMVLLIPWWLLNAVWWFMMVLLWCFETNNNNNNRVLAAIVGQTCWIIGCILLALAWDDDEDSSTTNWHKVAIPFYLWQITHIVTAVFDIREIRQNNAKMISPEHLQEVAGTDATEEDLMELAQEYIVVTVDHAEVAAAIHLINTTSEKSLTNAEMEELKIHMSPEYQRNENIIQYHTEQIAKHCLVDLPFIALVASQLDGNIDTSWWVVFLPILIYLGSKLVQSFCTCCFSFSPDPGVILVGDNNDEGLKQESPEEEKVNEDKTTVDDDDEKAASSALNDGTMPSHQDPLSNDDHVTNGIDSLTKTEEGAEKTEDLPKGFVDEVEEPSTTFADASGDIEDFNLRSETKAEESKAGGPKIDEETYRAWQSAYARAEESELEKQAKAHSTCCLVSFQLVMVCLVVGKLDEDYETDGDISYNSFWILFPIFLIVGLLLLCCSCLIYSAGLEGAHVSGSVPNNDESGNADTSGKKENENPIIFVPPPPPSESTTDDKRADITQHPESLDSQASTDETTSDENKAKLGGVESKEDMNDLD
ncbi:hypothetical protein FisN_19Lh154 [Fistulifera solaris]|uniref:J domain-containing protein n=1 Tax=Fistulifera solaris TaxID=1519565 RepID=A0A1Z5J6R3_FISSO|nr:hypothetical protein FisN_19Lh154 [Fistulifera solaris]|eukprot:GAX09687.1 hypothetical protein FisN_19Lh154 [Fistulifera solaris]